jgi:hypothetical protein
MLSQIVELLKLLRAPLAAVMTGLPCFQETLAAVAQDEAGVGLACKKRKAVGCVKSLTSGLRSGNAKWPHMKHGDAPWKNHIASYYKTRNRVTYSRFTLNTAAPMTCQVAWSPPLAGSWLSVSRVACCL